MAIQLDDMALFSRIVELGTLSAAARERNVPVSQVTRALARLEAACGARLLHRSTHGLSLTDEGDAVLAHGRRLLDTAAELQGELSGKVSGPSGWVRMSVSPVLAQAVIAPSLPTLYRRHPQLQVDIAADDRMVDMAREGIDIALRTGTTHTDTVVARQIGELKRALFASPAYVAEFGLPASPGELEAHRLIANSGNPALNRWTMARGKGAARAAGQGPHAHRQHRGRAVAGAARRGHRAARRAGGAAAGEARRAGAGAARALRDAGRADVCGDAAGAAPTAQGARLHRPPGRVAAGAAGRLRSSGSAAGR